MKFKKGYVLKQKDLKTASWPSRAFDVESKHSQPSYVMEIDETKYLIRRTGECKPEKCGSVCCKIMAGSSSEDNGYHSGFWDRKIGNKFIIHKTCRFLKDNKCSRWKKKSFPDECSQFPHPTDGVYIAVAPKCSFKFVVDEVIA